MKNNPTQKHQCIKALVLFLFGSIAYAWIELSWRGYTHWTMAVLGGVLFLLIGGINNWFPWEMPLVLQALIGAAYVTAAEFIFGIVLNIWLGMNIWDYSDMPFNLLGQICPQFTLAWFFLSFLAIHIDDTLRYFLFREKYPTYRLF